MPLYDYLCGDCGPFDALRPMALSAEPEPCPGCGASAPRVILTAPALACVSAGRRNAIETNEKSRERPMNTGEFAAKQARHRAGCACCKTTPLTKPKSAAKSFAGKRPWMISH